MSDKSLSLQNIISSLADCQIDLTKFKQKFSNKTQITTRSYQKCWNLYETEVSRLKTEFQELSYAWKSQLPLVFAEFMEILKKIVELYQQKLANLVQENKKIQYSYQKLLKEFGNSSFRKQVPTSANRVSISKQSQNDRKSLSAKKYSQPKIRRNSLNRNQTSSFNINNQVKRFSFDHRISSLKKNNNKISYITAEGSRQPDERDFNPNDLTVFQQHITQLFIEQQPTQTAAQQLPLILKDVKSKTLNDIKAQSENSMENSKNQFMKSAQQWKKTLFNKLPKQNKESSKKYKNVAHQKNKDKVGFSDFAKSLYKHNKNQWR